MSFIGRTSAFSSRRSEPVKLWDAAAALNSSPNAESESAEYNPNRKIFDLNEFNLSRIPNDGTVIAYGKRRSGKTTFSDQMFQDKLKVYPLVLTMSQTAFNEHWQQTMPFHHVHQGYEPALIKMLMSRCMAVENFNKYHSVEEWIDPRWALNLDDVIAYEKESSTDANLMYDAELRKTFVMGRHFSGFCNVNVQYANALLPVIKDNADIAIIFRQMSNRQKRALWLDYGDTLNEWEFDNLLRTYTGMDETSQDRDVLVVDTTSMAENPLKTFYKYQVHKIPEEELQPLGHYTYWAQAYKKALKQADDARKRASSSYLAMPTNSYLNTPVNPMTGGNSVWEALRQGRSYT
jgi:hypothetical protein